jgi:hypothetical protein
VQPEITTEQLAVSIPSGFYVIVGTFIIANIGSIIAFLWGGLKMYTTAIVWKTTVDMKLAKHDKDIQNAFNKIRERGSGE